MNKTFIFLAIANIAIAYPRPLLGAKVKETDLISTPISGSDETLGQNNVIVGLFIVAATIAVCSLIALAFAMRKVKVLTKKCRNAPVADTEAQVIPPPDIESVSCQAFFSGQEIGIQTYTPTLLDVATQKSARIEAPCTGTFAERIGSVTRVLMEGWAGNSSANLNEKAAPVTRSSYAANRELIAWRARELEHVLTLANRKRFAPPAWDILEEKADNVRAEIAAQRTFQFKRTMAKTGCPDQTLELLNSESYLEFKLNEEIIDHVRSMGFLSDDSETETDSDTELCQLV